MKGIGRFARNIFHSIADVGESFLDHTGIRGTALQKLLKLSNDLVSHKGAASGMALAREVFILYKSLDHLERLIFFKHLQRDFGPDIKTIKKISKDFIENPGEKTAEKLRESSISKRIKLFNRMNMAPNGTESIVHLREDLMSLLKNHPDLKPIDQDLKSLLKTWFNPGFLILKKIDWDTEAAILEKIILYDTVHNIDNWNDLKQRLVENRRCFAFFHPALEDEPLIFVEVALTRGIAPSMSSIFKLTEPPTPTKMNTAIFYSINNCQSGLRGIPLGNFLIKRVVAEIEIEIPSIKKFSSLSPVPGFSKWLIKQTNLKEANIPEIDKMMLMMLNKENWHQDPRAVSKLKRPLIKACAHYLKNVKKRNRPENAVARFHFGNGAELFRINWMGNTTKQGLNDSFGIMVNYRYDPRQIESNHEKYTRNGELALSKSIRSLLSS